MIERNVSFFEKEHFINASSRYKKDKPGLCNKTMIKHRGCTQATHTPTQRLKQANINNRHLQRKKYTIHNQKEEGLWPTPSCKVNN
jgi:hypothetical protein